MPIFEFTCKECGQGFEALVGPSSAPRCPSCRSEALTRQLSVFSVGGRGPALASREPVGPCRTCGDPRGPGSCALG